MKISIIIPALNEEENLQKLIPCLLKNQAGHLHEIIVVDGGSTDQTVQTAKKHGAKAVRSSKKGRAVQMNLGAAEAGAEILYFLHADSTPPVHFDEEILKRVYAGAASGCFTLRFDYPHFALKLYAFFTSLKTAYVRFGDQSLFVKKAVFNEINGFDEGLILMEDQEIIHRLKKRASFELIKKPVVTSARKYKKNGVFRLQLIFSIIFLLYYFGARQDTLVQIYKNLIRTE